MNEFYSTFKQERIPIFKNLFQKIAVEETLANLFYETSLPKYQNHTLVSFINKDAQIINKKYQI